MPRPLSHPVPPAAARDLDLDDLPNVGTAELCARLHTRHYGPISPRTIRERWGLTWRIVNSRAVTDVVAFLAEAGRRFDAAPVVIGAPRLADAAASDSAGDRCARAAA